MFCLTHDSGGEFYDFSSSLEMPTVRIQRRISRAALLQSAYCVSQYNKSNSCKCQRFPLVSTFPRVYCTFHYHILTTPQLRVVNENSLSAPVLQPYVARIIRIVNEIFTLSSNSHLEGSAGIRYISDNTFTTHNHSILSSQGVISSQRQNLYALILDTIGICNTASLSGTPLERGMKNSRVELSSIPSLTEEIHQGAS